MLKECVLSLPPERYSTPAHGAFLTKKTRGKETTRSFKTLVVVVVVVWPNFGASSTPERTGGSKPDVLLVCVSFRVLFFLFNSPKISPICLGFGFGF